jgi:amidase
MEDLVTDIETSTSPNDGRPPQDALIDRREYLRRMAVAAGAISLGALAPGLLSGAVAGAPSSEAPSPFLRGGLGYATSVRPEALAEITELTISEAASLIRGNKLKPSELVQAYVSRIQTFDAVYKAFNLVNGSSAMSEASKLDSMPHMGVLHSIPLAIKDNYYTQGIVTTANSHIFQNFVPDFNATTVARLKA